MNDDIPDLEPPQFGRLLPQRSDATDKSALKEASDALDAIVLRRKKYNPNAKTRKEASQNKKGTTIVPTVTLPLGEVFDDEGKWQETTEDTESGAKRFRWSCFGFPDDESLTVNDFEAETNISIQDSSVLKLAQDILDIKTKSAMYIADSGVERKEKNKRVLETFTLHGRTVTKVTIEDAEVKNGKYDKTETAKEFEKSVNELFEKPALEEFMKTADQSLKKRELNKLKTIVRHKAVLQPDLIIEQYVTTHILLREGGEVIIFSYFYYFLLEENQIELLLIFPLSRCLANAKTRGEKQETSLSSCYISTPSSRRPSGNN
jgi:hypothetical protein